MGYVRNKINDLSPTSVRQMNSNFEQIWNKVFGDIDTYDLRNQAVTGAKIAKNTITADNIDVTTLYVGTGGIKMNSTASITWKQVSDLPTIVGSDNVNYDLETVFKEITDNGLKRGLFMNNGSLFINADYIQAGTISAARIKTDDLLVGRNIKLAPEARISWNIVTDNDGVVTQDNIVTKLKNYVTGSNWDTILTDYLVFGDVYTQIGSDFVITGKLAATNILAGEITGCTIKTASSTNYITLKNQYLTLYNDSSEKVRLGYDNFYGTGIIPYLYLGNSSIKGGSTLDMTANGYGIFQSNGTSINFLKNTTVQGDLTVTGAVSFPTSTFTVTAKFA